MLRILLALAVAAGAVVGAPISAFIFVGLMLDVGVGWICPSNSAFGGYCAREGVLLVPIFVVSALTLVALIAAMVWAIRGDTKGG